jgi:hypothetical protein
LTGRKPLFAGHFRVVPDNDEKIALLAIILLKTPWAAHDEHE